MNKKPKDYTILLIGIVILIAVLAASCGKSGNQHTCRWDLCPYKGATANNASHVVSVYVGEIGTDAYCIDMLHIQYPNEEYEQLEDRLWCK